MTGKKDDRFSRATQAALGELGLRDFIAQAEHLGEQIDRAVDQTSRAFREGETEGEQGDAPAEGAVPALARAAGRLFGAWGKSGSSKRGKGA